MFIAYKWALTSRAADIRFWHNNAIVRARRVVTLVSLILFEVLLKIFDIICVAMSMLEACVSYFVVSV